MIEITINEAIERLMNAYPGLYTDFVSTLHDSYTISKSRAYEYHGSVIVKTFRSESESRKVLESGKATNEDLRGRGLLYELATYDCAKE